MSLQLITTHGPQLTDSSRQLGAAARHLRLILQANPSVGTALIDLIAAVYRRDVKGELDDRAIEATAKQINGQDVPEGA